MKRSRAVHAFLIVSAAGTLNSCGQKHEAVRRCVDENGNYSDDRNCSSPGGGSGGHRYAYVYTPAGSTANAADTGAAAKTTSGAGTTRGVIGSAGASHSGGEGGGGAHGGGGGE